MASKLGVELAHAGRKGPTTPPAAGGKPILTKETDAWTPEAPSAIPYDTGWPAARMTRDDIKRCIGEFAAAAKRVDRIGYDVIELHAAHGYLAHQFLSPLSNQRIDEYGGSLENRMRFAIEMYEAVRAVWPNRSHSACAFPHRLGRWRLDAGGNHSSCQELRTRHGLHGRVDGRARPEEKIPLRPAIRFHSPRR